MTIIGVDIDRIVELDTQLAQSGAIRAAETVADDMFEQTVGIAILIYTQDPPFN